MKKTIKKHRCRRKAIMKHTTKAAEKSTVKITLKFDGEEWKAAQQSAYMKTRARFAINGFRKGKAPRAMIERAYGEEVFFLLIIPCNAYLSVVKELYLRFYSHIFAAEPRVLKNDN